MKFPCKRLNLFMWVGSGQENRVLGTRPYGDVVFTQPRLSRWGTVRLASSDDQGQVQVANGRAVINDDDGYMRSAIAEDTQRFIKETEASIEVLSEEVRKATDGVDWRFVLRGKVKERTHGIDRTERMRRRTIDLQIMDALAPYLDRTLPNVPFLRSDFPNIHRDIENTMIPLIGGEHSFTNATDVMGNPVPPGLTPVIHAGKIRTVGGNPEFGGGSETSSPAYLSPPTISYSINGTPGTKTLYIGMTKLSEVGETVLGNILQIENAPNVLSSTNSIQITGFADPAATGYVVYVSEYPTPTGRLRVLGAGTTTYVHDGTDTPKPPGPPAVNTAQTPAVDGSFFWEFFVIALGRNLRFTAIYASDTAKGTAPKRVAEPAFITHGTDFLTPESVNWPFPNYWITLPSGIDVIGFFGRGPRAQDHIDGIVTIAVDTCGYLGENDEPIRQAGPMLQLFLNEFVLKNGGEGYRSGDWGPLETYSDGVSKLLTDKFTAWQNLTKLFMDNSVGYLANIYLREPITVRTFLQWFFQTFDALGVTDHNGRWYIWSYDPFTAASAGTLFRERLEIKRLLPPIPDNTHVEPFIRYQYGYNPDTQQYMSEVELAKGDPEAEEDVKNEFKNRGTVLCRFSRDRDTVRDAQRRRSKRLARPRWKQGLVTGFQPGLEAVIGDRFRVTHSDGPLGSTGWTDHPFTLTQVEVDMVNDEVILTGYDTEPIIQGEDVMGPGATMPFVMA